MGYGLGVKRGECGMMGRRDMVMGRFIREKLEFERRG